MAVGNVDTVHHTWDQSDNGPVADEQNYQGQRTENQAADLQHTGEWAQSDPPIHDGEILVDNNPGANPAQEERDPRPMQDDGRRPEPGNQIDAHGMLEIYLQQTRREEPWKPGQNR